MLSTDCWRIPLGLTWSEITLIVLPRCRRALMKNKFYLNLLGIQIKFSLQVPVITWYSALITTNRTCTIAMNSHISLDKLKVAP
jgi:hypothetical protein